MAAPQRRIIGSSSASALGVRARRLGIAVAVFVPLVFTPSLEAQTAFASGQHDPRDIRITLKARQALTQDNELGRFLICPTVRQGNVLLWGRVPNDALAERAVRLVSEIQGVFNVRSEIVIGPVEPIRDESPRLPGSIALPHASEPPGRRDPRPRGVLAGNPRQPPLGDSVEIGRPTPLSADSSGTAAPAILLAPRPLAKKETLQSSIERVIQSDVRYAGVRYDERAGTVTLSGTAARMEHVMELSGQVARLPGVKEVVVESLRIRP
jgi:hypothetical protein